MRRIYISSSVCGEDTSRIAKVLSGVAEVGVVATLSEKQYRAGAGKGAFARFFLRWRMMVVHPLRLGIKLLTAPKGSVFIVTTNPFFVPTLAAWGGKWRGHRVIQLLYDLYPDALEVSGAAKPDGGWARLLGVIPRQALRHSYGTIFLGEELARHAERRWGPAKRRWIIPVIVPEPWQEEPTHRGSGSPSRERENRELKNLSEAKKLRFYSSGQLGRMHDAGRLGELLAGFAETAEPALRANACWTFRVSGAGVPEFEKALSRAKAIFLSRNESEASAAEGEGCEDGGVPLSVTLAPPLASDEWRAKAGASEIGVVSLSEGAANVAFPSKAYGMMSCGLAILALCPADSDLGRLIRENECGWVVDNRERGMQSSEPSYARRATGGERRTSNVEHRTSNDREEKSLDLQERWNATIRAIMENPAERLRRRQNAWNCVRRLNGEASRALRRVVEEEG